MKDKKSLPFKTRNVRKEFAFLLEEKVYKMYTLFAPPLMVLYFCTKPKIRQLP